jgi:hypothetical protein
MQSGPSLHERVETGAASGIPVVRRGRYNRISDGQHDSCPYRQQEPSSYLTGAVCSYSLLFPPGQSSRQSMPMMLPRSSWSRTVSALTPMEVNGRLPVWKGPTLGAFAVPRLRLLIDNAPATAVPPRPFRGVSRAVAWQGVSPDHRSDPRSFHSSSWVRPLHGIPMRRRW